MQEHLAMMADDELSESREINAELLAVLKEALRMWEDSTGPGSDQFPVNEAEAIIVKAEKFLH